MLETIIIETADEARRQIIGSIYNDDDAKINLIDAIKTWANCHEADVSADGNIWICSPQRGHWLNDDDLVVFVNWTAKQ